MEHSFHSTGNRPNTTESQDYICRRTSAAAAFNQLIGSLTPEQRKLLGEMLHEERAGTIHDVLAMLTWWILSQGLGFTFRGEPCQWN